MNFKMVDFASFIYFFYFIICPTCQSVNEIALTDRNMQVRFFLKVVLKSRDLRNFASTTSFYEMYTVHHLWPNLQTCRLVFWKNDLNVKLFLKKSMFFGIYWIFWMYMAHSIDLMKTGCTSKISQISGFQDHLQTKYNLYISICQS